MIDRDDFLSSVTDVDAMVDWYRRGADAEDPECTFYLGVCYEYGKGVPESLHDATALYAKAAGLGYPEAFFHLGELYEGPLSEMDKADFMARSYYKVAAEKGIEEAKKCLERLEASAPARASANAERLYQEGLDALAVRSLDPVRVHKAIDCFAEASSLRHLGAMCRLAEMYLKGEGVVPDYHKAHDYYYAASKLGSADAECALGEMYENGLGVERSYDEAVKWYLKAMLAENARACYHIGVICEEGKGRPVSIEEAILFYDLAGNLGDTDGAAAAERLRQSDPPTE